MKYVPIGEFVTFGDEVFKCTEVVGDIIGSCKYCDFNSYGEECNSAVCNADDRGDLTEVIFILYDTLEDSDND